MDVLKIVSYKFHFVAHHSSVSMKPTAKYDSIKVMTLVEEKKSGKNGFYWYLAGRGMRYKVLGL